MSPIRMMSECANAEDHFTKSWNFAYNVALLYKMFYNKIDIEITKRSVIGTWKKLSRLREDTG